MRIARIHVGAKRHTTKVALAAGAVLMLSITACAGSSSPSSSATTATTAPSKTATADLLGPANAATGTPVKIGMISDGATDAFDNTSELVAAKATADYWNAHKGGLNGHKVEIVTCATKGDPAGGTDCGNQMVQDNVAAVALSQSAVAESVWPPIHTAGIPMMFLGANGNDLLKDAKSTYNLNNGNGTLFTVPVSVAKQNHIKKVTFVVIDVPQALTSFESVGPALLKANGITYVVVKVAPGTADMTTQMQAVANNGSGLVHVIGNDSFCIAAFNGLKDVGYTGKVSSINQCITDATRKQAPPSILDGMYVTALTTVGDTTDPGYQKYVAVMKKYSTITDFNDQAPMGAYTTVSSLLTAMAGVKGDITAASANAAIRAMPESEIPGAGGMKFKCDGTASKQYPSVCSSQTLQAQLDEHGNPKSYSVGPSLSGSN